MKKVKQFSFIVLMALMVALLIAGCSSSSNENENANKNAASNGENSSVETGGAILEILANINSLTLDLEEIPYIQDVSEKTGVEIDWTYVRTDWEEQKNPLLAGGDLPDIFISAIGPEDIATYDGLFLPLNDLIEEHAPNIQKMFKEMPEVKELATSGDGNIYGLPSVTPHNPASQTLPMMNQDWLDAVGLEEPETFDELYNVLKAFKEEDPNGNGIADEIPFDWAPDLGAYSAMSLIGGYGNFATNPFNWANTVKDGEHIFVFETEDYKELVSFLHKLYSEGLVNQEVFTQDWDQFFSRSQNPDGATVGFTIGWNLEQRVGQWSDQYTIVTPFAAREGITPLWPADPVGMATQTNRAVVSASTEDPVAAIKWLDEFYSEETSAQGYYGSFGVGIEQVDNEYVTMAPPEGISEDEWKWTNALVDHGLMYVPEELNDRIIPPASVAERLEQGDLLNDNYPAPENVMPNLKFTLEESDELSLLDTDLWNLFEVKWADWIVNGGVEEEWDSYLEELDRIGLPRYKEIYQNAYDAVK